MVDGTASGTPCQFPNGILKTLQRFIADLTAFHLTTAGEGKAQKAAFPGAVHRAFARIHCQF